MTDGETLLELRTGAVAAGGGCVARADDGRVVFVRHALPDERVLARVTAETSSYLRADAVEILDPSPDRVSPPCPFAGPDQCGGCDWQHVALPTQRAWKSALVSEQLRRLAGIDARVVTEEVPGAVEGLGWRTRVRFAVDRTGRVGLRKHRSHQVQLIDRCLIASPAIEALAVEKARWPGAREVEVFAAPDGAQRTVSVTSSHRRDNRRSDVYLSLGQPTTLRTFSDRGSSPFEHPPGVLTTGRPHLISQVDAGMVVDGRLRRAPGSVRVDVLGHAFDVSAGAFWQVHPGAPSVLVGAVLDGLEARGGERAVDLYAGAGLFTVFLGDAVGPEGSVVAVERDPRTGTDAVRNTAGQAHVEVRFAEVTPELVAGEIGRPDLIVLDPAREGAGRAVMEAIAGLDPAPRRVVYVSCDPATFARDLRVVLDADWRLASLRSFDLFPMTEHVEIVAVLEPMRR